jgi:DNA-binding CsgD family transcriptional regulator
MMCYDRTHNDDIMDLRKFATFSILVQDVDELFKAFRRTLTHECGYDRVVFTLVSNHPSLDLKAGHGVVHHYPGDWMQHYFANGYEFIDPVRRYCLRSVAPFAWEKLPELMKLTPQQIRLMDESREAGLHNGAAILLRGLAGEVAGVGAAMSVQKKFDNQLDRETKLAIFNALAHIFYVAFCRISAVKNNIQKEAVEEVILTKRESDVLRYMLSAKKTIAIADILNMSENTAEFHVRNILRKFHAVNRTEVILKAAYCGILNMDKACWIREAG